VLKVNKKIKQFAVNAVSDVAKKEDMIGILGLSFKPDSDDVRESPSGDIISGLLKKGFNKIIAYDPLANDSFQQAYNFPITYAETMEAVIEQASHILVLTAWREFKEKSELFQNKKLYDFRYFI